VGLKALEGARQLREIKAAEKLSWNELARLTGFHAVSLKQWGRGAKAVSVVALRTIRRQLELAKNGKGT
jgi:DNA-binding transcriptional regulator YiaG